MTVMDVIAVGYLKSLNIKNIHRIDNGVHRELIVKVLIKLAIGTFILMGTGLKINPLFNVVEAGSLPWWQFFQLVLPKNNFAPFSDGYSPFFPEGSVFPSDSAQGSVKTTSGAIKIVGTKSVPHHPCLHPNAGVVLGRRLILPKG